MAPEGGPSSPAPDGLTPSPPSWPSPRHRLTPPHTQMALLASLSTTGLGGQSVFNEIAGAEHLGRARRTDQGHSCPLCLDAWGRGGEESLSSRAEGRPVRRQEGKESPQDLGLETVSEELGCASGLGCDAGPSLGLSLLVWKMASVASDSPAVARGGLTSGKHGQVL